MADVDAADPEAGASDLAQHREQPLADLDRRGLHPELGVVTLRQHLATWVAHDLGHIDQIVRAMARQYSDAIGPWRAFLSIVGPSRT